MCLLIVLVIFGQLPVANVPKTAENIVIEETYEFIRIMNFEHKVVNVWCEVKLMVLISGCVF